MNSDPLKLDLDSILPEQGEIEYQGQTFKVNQPTLEDLVFLNKIINAIQKADGSTGVSGILSELNDYLPKLIPGFGKSVTLQQAMALVRFFFDLSTPPEARALAEHGITPADNAEKKTTDTVS